jgi:hypothetical protein
MCSFFRQKLASYGNLVALWDVDGQTHGHPQCPHCKNSVPTAKGATQMAKASKKDIKKKIAARLEKIAKHEGKIKKLKKALK